MQVSFHIICADTALGRVQDCLRENLSTCMRLAIAPYWKIPGCSEITCTHSDIPMDTGDLQEVVRKISRKNNLSISYQGDCVEYSAYATTEEIMSSDDRAFVVCFVNMKENAI